jgi:beta-barrel assembly-enhancing protease
MKRLLDPLAAGIFAIALTAGPAVAARQQSAPPQQTSTTSTASQQQTATPPQTNTSAPATSQDKNTQPGQSQTSQPPQSAPTQPTINPNVPPPPPPDAQSAPAPDAKTGSAATPANGSAKPKPGDDTPVPQQAQPNVKQGSKQDVEAIGDRGVGKGVDFYSIEKEIALGKSLAQEVEKVSKLVDDPIIVEYVNRVGQNLVRNSDAKVPFTIKVIDSDEINAFALPGGFFYVNSGLILRASEEAELAGVMAHEISHVAARHGTRNETKAQIMQLATIPLILLGPGGWAGYGIYEAAQFAIPMSYLKFTRDAEREADFLGVQYMYKAGYDPNAYVAFFEKILAEEKRQPGSIPKVFSTHPPTPERITNTQKEIATILPARDSYIVSTSEFDQVKARLTVYEHRNKAKAGKGGGPTLRTKTEQKKDPTANPTTTSDSDDSDRPVLKKRDGSTDGKANCPPPGTSGTTTGTTTTTTGTSTACGNGNAIVSNAIGFNQN